jgi:Na+/phosphate symporter
MKHFTLIFAACLCIAIVAVPQPKTKAVPVDEVELMLEKISSHLQEASVATAQAHEMSDKMVEEKVAEKAELKEAVVKAEEKVEKMEEKIEVFAVKMMGAGLDTTTQPIQFKGVIYDAYLNYVSEGGKEDFEYFRVYLWQPK